MEEIEILSQKPKEEVLDFIRKRLFVEGQTEHRKFNMSGYESKTGECTVSNTAILNEFADLGIYDYTDYLFLDFYKGTPTVYLKYWGEEKNLEFNFDGYTTSEIIYEVFKLTIFSGMKKRRRK
ncbi:hypothetical protein [Phocaeicola sp.]